MNTHKRYDWDEVQKLYDTGLSYREMYNTIGITGSTLQKANTRGVFRPRTLNEASKIGATKIDQSLIWTPERRKTQSEAKKKLYKEHPEKHPNRKLANNRQQMSYPEKLVYDWLTTQSIEFIHQRKIDKYYVDFNIGSLCIEVDGKYFHNKESDIKRDKIISDLGFTIRRVSASNIIKHGASIVLDESIPDDILAKHIDLRKPRICPICKSTYYGKRTICSDECKKASREKRIQQITKPNGTIQIKCTIPPVSKADLQKLIDSNTPFTTIGKQYGVSDNAVRKWCKKYNIDPTKQSVIDENKLTELVTTGRGIKYISRELKATPERLYKIIDKLGLTVVDNRPKQISIELVNRVKELIDEGKRNTDIIPLVGLDHQQVSAIRCKYKNSLTLTIENTILDT
jgi:very-short-patch-repair endonuclease